ncbi:MAG: DUF1501 domain-containing protein [Verrucomicrobia bacterium]|nr:DUF1501 domain-containing protein [Verrucomicrobiota bacterium]
MKRTSTLTRRDFLRTTSLGLAAASVGAPSLLARPSRGERALVVLELSGGNDGLNTIVPFGDDAYYRERPTLAIKPADVLKIGDRLGFNASLKPLMPLWDGGQMAVVNGVGYPNPNRSHFRSMEIWHTAADADATEPHGWLGRYFDHACPECGTPELAVSVAREVPHAITGRAGVGVAVDGASEKIGAALARGRVNGAAYPDTTFGHGLAQIAAMVGGGLDARVYCHEICGFDTHANQLPNHARLWNETGAGLAAFFRDLERRGAAERVLVMAFSEFGRRVTENGSDGCDHGAAGPVFLWGRPVRGGLHGVMPGLTDLDGGDLKMTVDFRGVYATVLEGWMGVKPAHVLGREFPKLAVLA